MESDSLDPPRRRGHTSSMKLAAIQSSLDSFGRPLLALGVTLIFAFALESGVALGTEHGGVGGGAASAAEWVPYRNSATGLSFRYPRSLRIRERDPRPFGLPDAEEITDLLGATDADPDTIVLRFLVNRGTITPETAADKARAMREKYASEDPDSRESLTAMQLDGHEALVTVDCGRGACQWSVRVLQPRECRILSQVGSASVEDALPPPHDGTFPLLSIIRTVHFD